MSDTPTEPQQSTAWMEPLAEADNPDDLYDDDGRIKDSPANDQDDDG